MKLILPFSILIIILVTSCGKSSSSGSSSGSKSDGTSQSRSVADWTNSYEFFAGNGVNECSTGEITISTDSEVELSLAYCHVLQDNKLNNNCALEERKKEFEKFCDGMDWAPFNAE